MPRRLALAYLIVASLFSLAAAAQDWSEARTEHFSVVAPLGDRQIVAAAQNAEQLRDVMGRLLARRDLHVSAPAYILLFASPEAMSTVLGTPPETDEVSYAGPDAVFFAYVAGSEPALTRFQFDFGRYLISVNFPHTPPWFDDGLAAYFSSARIRDQLELRMGMPPDDVAGTLRKAAWLPIEQVLSAGEDSPLRKDERFRAESWAMVHYVFTSQKMGETGQYFGLTQNQQIAVPEAIRQAFSMSPEQLDRAVHAAALALPVKPGKEDAPAAPAETTVTVFVETPADLEALAADYRLHAAPNDADLAALQALLQKGNNIAALRTLGFSCLQKKDLARAADFLQRAAALDPKDLRTQYYLGRLAYEEAQQPGGGNPRDARAPLRLAILARPDFADAHYLLGEALLGGTEPGDGIQALQAAVRLAPRDDRYSLALAAAYLQVRDFDRGEAVLDRLSRSPDPQVAAAAAKQLASIAELKKEPASPEVDTSIYRYSEKQWGEPGSKIPSISELDAEIKEREAAAAAAKPDTRPVRFATGLLLRVDCSQPPSAILTVVIKGSPVTFYAADVSRLPVIGAQGLACSWKDRQVAINYRPGSERAENDLVSVELK
jgi:Flp pilus assembly protein TadD